MYTHTPFLYYTETDPAILVKDWEEWQTSSWNHKISRQGVTQKKKGFFISANHLILSKLSSKYFKLN